MPQSYTPEFKKKIVRLHLEERRTYILDNPFLTPNHTAKPEIIQLSMSTSRAKYTPTKRDKVNDNSTNIWYNFQHVTINNMMLGTKDILPLVS